MTKLLPILFMSILLSAEMEVDGNLKVTGTVESATIDSLKEVIAKLEIRSGFNGLTEINTDIWIVPEGVYGINVYLIGAGGGGVQTWTSNTGCSGAGAGGGAGGYVNAIFSVEPLDTLYFIKGIGGNGDYNPGPGTHTSVQNSSGEIIAIAYGGNGGSGSSGGSGATGSITHGNGIIRNGGSGSSVGNSALHGGTGGSINVLGSIYGEFGAGGKGGGCPHNVSAQSGFDGYILIKW